MKDIPGSTNDCVICGQDQKHRAMCYVGLTVCCGNCEDALEALVAAEVRGDVAAAETERVVITDHPFISSPLLASECVRCRAPRSLHAVEVRPV